MLDLSNKDRRDPMKYIHTQDNPLSKTAFWFSVLIVTTFQTAFAYAQLTDQDFMDLEAQSKKQGWTFTVGPTEASQRPQECLSGVVFNEQFWQEAEARPADPLFLHKQSLPSRFDWRDQVSPPFPRVKDQGYCGACWAFATTSVLEWAIKIHDGDWVDLSTQWLLACNTELFMHDCDGGFIQLRYFKDKTDLCGDSGAVLENDYPYTGRDDDCNCPYTHHYWIRDHGSLSTFLNMPSVEQIKAVLYEHGPLACYVMTSKSFVAYTGGVYNDVKEDKFFDMPDHAVVIIGWDDAKNAWLIQNSWGEYWGTNGYGYMQYGVDFIGSSASWVVYGDELKVSPDTMFFSGEAGKLSEIAEQSLFLNNTGTEPLLWTATVPEWLQLSQDAGSLEARASLTLTASLSPRAASMQAGQYSGDILIGNENSGALHNITVTLEVKPPVLYSFPLDSDPGWTTDRGWAFGRPTGQGSWNGDPQSAYTGSRVYGYNLQGNYENNMPPRYLTTTALDFSKASGVTLRFMRWLGVEQRAYDRATVQASNDGSTWITVWENPYGTAVEDRSWKECIYDISAVADGQAHVQVRWVMGPTDYSGIWPGWNLDDIEFRAELEEDPEPCHPADENNNGIIEKQEADLWLKRWQEGDLPMNQAIRVLFLWKEGGHYRYDESRDEPLCWILQ